LRCDPILILRRSGELNETVIQDAYAISFGRLVIPAVFLADFSLRETRWRYFGEPIRTSNCALAWSGASSCYGVLPGKERHGDGRSRVGNAVATASLIESRIDR
jgi:hypothetical protein